MLFSPPPPPHSQRSLLPAPQETKKSAAPLAASVILLHAGSFEFDRSLVTIPKDDSLLLETPHRMLSLNTQLLAPFLAAYKQPNSQTTARCKGTARGGKGTARQWSFPLTSLCP